MSLTHPKLFCFGYGYSCDFLGHALLSAGQGWEVAGTTRDGQKKAQMKQRGIGAYIFDYEKPLGDPAAFFNGVTHVLVSTPPNDDGDPVFWMHGEDIAKIPTLQWFGYLSATSVYGDRDGALVDEKSSVQPSNKRGSRRALAEDQWASLQHKYGLPVHIFRIAGIYGPARSAIDSVRAGIARRINKPGHVFGRIHVEDIVQVLVRSMENPKPGEIYNICDDAPGPSHEVITYACELLGIEPPPLLEYDEIDMAPIAKSFYEDNKRVSNEKIKRDLGITLKYPDYKTGLDACLAAEKTALEIMEHDGPGESQASGKETATAG